MPQKEVATYLAEIAAGSQTANVRARIALYDGKKNTIGTLVFVEDGPIPGNVLTGPPIGYFPVERYADVLDLLRNEKPVYLGTSGGNLTIGTAFETVGDGEPAPSFIKRSI